MTPIAITPRTGLSGVGFVSGFVVFGRIVFVDGILEFFDAAAQSAHQFGDFLASEEQDDYQYDYDDLPVTDCTRDKHGFFF